MKGPAELRDRILLYQQAGQEAKRAAQSYTSSLFVVSRQAEEDLALQPGGIFNRLQASVDAINL
jgi:hypothetical protein